MMHPELLELLVDLVDPSIRHRLPEDWPLLDFLPNFFDTAAARLGEIMAAPRTNDAAPSASRCSLPNPSSKAAKKARERAPYRPKVKPNEIERAAARRALARAGLVSVGGGR